MNRKSPRGLDRKRVQQLHRVAESAARAAIRIDRISKTLIGEPYQINPLIGSADSAEIFTAAMNGFDCVTYIETVLALAQSSDAPRFADTLRRIRYADGRIDWLRRNHYMTEWIRNNIRSGSVQRVPGLKAGVEKRRTLNIVPGLSSRQARFSCVPKAAVLRQAQKLQTGDFIFFASTRPHLDVFHCGIIVNNGNGLRLRHASKGRGGVVEQELAEFLKQNRMAGVMVVRPVEAD